MTSTKTLYQDIKYTKPSLNSLTKALYHDIKYTKSSLNSFTKTLYQDIKKNKSSLNSLANEKRIQKYIKLIFNFQIIHITKMKSSIKDFFSKYDQMRRKLQIWSPLLEKSLFENFIFCAAIMQLGTHHSSRNSSSIFLEIRFCELDKKVISKRIYPICPCGMIFLKAK